MTREEFETLVKEEFRNAVPEKFRGLIRNVVFLVEDEPSEEVRREYGLNEGETLLGLYRGVALTARGDLYGVGATVPDTITLYRLPIQQEAREQGHDIHSVVRDTIWHEVAHHFGYDEDQVRRKEDLRRGSPEL